jgi:hypothetical protein
MTASKPTYTQTLHWKPEELRVLYLDLKATRQKLAPTWLGRGSPRQLPQWHTSSKKATPIPTKPSNIATPQAKHIQTMTFIPWSPIGLFEKESMGAISKHNIMKNTFNQTSKVPIVYSTLNNVKSSKF